MKLLNGDCLEVLKTLEDNSVDSIVTDPPYGLSFMGKKWDYDVPSVEVWEECLRVLKHGGHLLSFAGTRTQHRMAVNIEDAGFEIRDMIAWVYGSGFPKNHNLGDGWGTALKPALEPITLARKPLSEKTIAANVMKHGTGGLNIDGCRVETEDNLNGGDYAENGSDRYDGYENWRYKRDGNAGNFTQPQGRWPANLMHDGSDEVMSLFPDSKGQQGDVIGTEISRPAKNCYGEYGRVPAAKRNDGNGSAARFFYCAKASKKDRDEGNTHPTVKPTDLMRYLCRLITPPNGVILDPFMGSGSTGKAAKLEGFDFIGIEREIEYIEIAEKRIENANLSGNLSKSDNGNSKKQKNNKELKPNDVDDKFNIF